MVGPSVPSPAPMEGEGARGAGAAWTPCVPAVVRHAVQSPRAGREVAARAPLPLQPSYLWPQPPCMPCLLLRQSASSVAAECRGPLGTAAEAGGHGHKQPLLLFPQFYPLSVPDHPLIFRCTDICRILWRSGVLGRVNFTE